MLGASSLGQFGPAATRLPALGRRAVETERGRVPPNVPGPSLERAIPMGPARSRVLPPPPLPTPSRAACSPCARGGPSHDSGLCLFRKNARRRRRCQK